MSNFLYFLVILAIFWKRSHALSKISIEMQPYHYQYVDLGEPPSMENFPLKSSLKMHSIPTIVQQNIPLDQSILPLQPSLQPHSIANTAEVLTTAYEPIPEVKKPIKKKLRKKKRKTKKKPKKMHLRRIFKTRLITTTPYAEKVVSNYIDADKAKTINLAPIYDSESGMSYTQDDLAKICSETVQMSKNFGISDINSFAKNNCFLIRVYYPNVTCSQINQLVEYCASNGLM